MRQKQIGKLFLILDFFLIMEILHNINYEVTYKHLIRLFERSIDFGIVVDHNIDSRFNWKGRM